MVTNTNTEPAYARPTVHATTSGQRAPQRRLQWRWVYALLPLLLGLLWAARRQPLSRGGHLMMQGAIVLLVYGLLILWLNANRTALRPAQPASLPRLVYVVHVARTDGDTLDDRRTSKQTRTITMGTKLETNHATGLSKDV